MTEAQLIADVQIKMDESTPSGVFHSFDDYITQMLNEAAEEVALQVPLHLLTPKEFTLTAGTLLFYDSDLAFIVLESDNADFLRLNDLKFQNWSRSVRKVTVSNEQKYKYQDDPFLKCGYGKPTAMIKYGDVDGDSTLEKCLVCGKVSENEPVLLYTYIGAPATITGAATAYTGIPAIIHEALNWLAASKVLAIAGEYDASKYALEQYGILIKEKSLK